MSTNASIDTMFNAALNTLISAYTKVIEAAAISQERGRIKEKIEQAHKEVLGRFVGTEHYFDILKYVDSIRSIINGETHELQSNYCESKDTATP